MHYLLSTFLSTSTRKLIRCGNQMRFLFPFILGAILLSVLLVIFSFPVRAVTSAIIPLEVDTTLDSNAAGYQACTPVPGDCSLRGAISRANADTGNDYVIAIPEGTFTISLSGSGEDNNATGDLDLNGNITLSGVSAISTTLNGNQRDRVLHVLSGAAVTLKNLTITNGKAPNGVDGNPGVTGGSGGSGGGIFNSGTLTLTRTLLNGSVTGDGGDGGDGVSTPFCSGFGTRGGAGGSGGGVYNAGILAVNESHLFGNSSGKGGNGGSGYYCAMLGLWLGFGPGGDAGHGGGIYNTSGSVAIITNSTISENITGQGGEYFDTESLHEGAGDGGSGAGIFNVGTITVINSTLSGNLTGNGGDARDSGANQGPVGSGGHGGGLHNSGTMILENVTITANRTGTVGSQGYIRVGTTDGLGAGICAASGFVAYQNTIVAGNDSPVDANDDCYGTPTSEGYNLIGNGTGCPTSGTGDRATANPLLGPLADNGGETQTHALLAGSPAIDQIPNGINGCMVNSSVDQRGAVRAGGANRGGTHCEIGAFEYDSGETPNLIMLKDLSCHSGDPQLWLIAALVLVGWGLPGGWQLWRQKKAPY